MATDSEARKGEASPRFTFRPSDFGRAAGDYAAFRQGFPESLFKRLAEAGIGRPGQSVLYLGTGVGFLSRGLARRGARLAALDLSLSRLRSPPKLD